MLNIILYYPNDYRHSMCDGLRQAAKHHLSNHLVLFILFSCNSQKKRLYLQYKRKKGGQVMSTNNTITSTSSLEISKWYLALTHS